VPDRAEPDRDRRRLTHWTVSMTRHTLHVI
jgi:hypothetical protein